MSGSRGGGAALPAALLLATALAGCSPGAAATGERQLGGGVVVVEPDHRRPAPALEGVPLAGRPVADVTALRGSVVLVNWYASWCGPCAREAAELRQVDSAYRSRGVRFVAVDLRDDPVSGAAFLRNQALDWPAVADPPGRTVLAFRGALPDTPPDTVLLDRRGRVAARVTGQASAGTLRPLLDDLLREPT